MNFVPVYVIFIFKIHFIWQVVVFSLEVVSIEAQSNTRITYAVGEFCKFMLDLNSTNVFLFILSLSKCLNLVRLAAFPPGKF